MCSVNFAIAPSKPIPASTLTARRSSASGSSARTFSLRERARVETTKSGPKNPPAAKTTAKRSADVGLEPTPMRKPKTRPPAAAAPLSARKVFGWILFASPAESSFIRTDSTVTRGFSFSTRPESDAEAGTSTRSRNLSCGGAPGMRNRP